MSRIKIEPNTKLGRSTYLHDVAAPEHVKDRSRRYSRFLCECGNEYTANLSSVYRGGHGCKECGLKIGGKLNKIHGCANKTKEYKLWAAIKDRCYNEKCKEYSFYGSRGIGMYEAWRTDFASFLEHIGTAPTPQHSMDRIDNNIGYMPGNLKWATKKEQANNRRSSKIVNYKGQDMTLSQFADLINRPYNQVWRIVSKKVPLEEVANFELNSSPTPLLLLDTQTGIFYETLASASRTFDIPETTLRRYVSNQRPNPTSLIIA